MIEIKVTNLHWIEESSSASDLCAHGTVQITVCGNRIDIKGEYCVSAAALYLLRTLDSDHSQSNRVAEHLLPCCGHDMHAVDGEPDVLIIGCPNGFDWTVEHDDATVSLTFARRESYKIPRAAWGSAVCAFSDTVSKFYDDSEAKSPTDAYAEDGYNAFLSEWSRRRKDAGQTPY